jgi:hypothetical protein
MEDIFGHSVHRMGCFFFTLTPNLVLTNVVLQSLIVNLWSILFLLALSFPTPASILPSHLTTL